MSDLRASVKLLSSQPLSVALIAVLVLPLAFGALTGLALGWSGPTYWTLLIMSIIGGLVAGYEHKSTISGLCRGACGATLFTTGLLGAHTMSGWPALVTVPEPVWILLSINVIAGSLFGALGGRARQKADDTACKAATER